MISVIMPVYNAAEFLRESIESILNQTEKNFELTIINDGSIREGYFVPSAVLLADSTEL